MQNCHFSMQCHQEKGDQCRLKTYSMSPKRLLDIAVLTTEWAIQVYFDKTVHRFDVMPGGRRLALHCFDTYIHLG